MRFYIQLLSLAILLNPELSGRNPEYTPEDSLPAIEKVYLHTDRTYYNPGDDIWFSAYLINAWERSLSGLSRNLHVELISPSHEIISSRILRLEGGLGNGDFKLPGNLSSGKYRLRAYTNYMRNFSDQIFFNKEISIINPSSPDVKSPGTDKYEKGSIEVDFFPESGSLVDDVPSLVAFKAVDDKGRGCDVSGTVYSSAGRLVTMFRSSHLGMGSFALKPVPGLSYYTIIPGPDNTEIRSELPKSFSSGVTLSASIKADKKLSIVVRTNEQTLGKVKNHDLKLTVSVRNEVVKTILIRINSISNNLILQTDDLPEGIIMLTLTTSEDLPLAERLIFIQPGQNLKVNVQPDRTVYKKRDPVSVNVTFTGDSIKQGTAFLSFSAAQDSYTDDVSDFPTTIASWFLLESDVHGTVEGPSYYFDPSNTDRLKDLDLLLMTQGWRDFTWKSDTTKYFSPESGFFISGKLRKLNKDKPLTDPKIHFTILQTDNIINEIVPVDRSGIFSLGNMDITGEAKLIATAVDRNGNPNGMLLIDSVNYMPAEVSGYIPASKVVNKDGALTLEKDDEIKEKETAQIKDYEIKESVRKMYRLSDTIPIGEVKITAQKPGDIQIKKIESVRSMYGGEPDDEVIVTPSMESLTSAPELLIGTVSGVYVTGSAGSYSIRFHRAMVFGGMSRVTPLLVIDGIRHDLSYLNFLPVSVIDRIDILKTAGKTAVYGLDGSNGVISVITRTGNRTATEPGLVKHTVNIKFSGYDTPRIFYSPRHDPASPSYSPDLRTTLLWEPDIRLQSGKEVLLKYYNADNVSTIRIIAEGITSTGIPVTGTAEYEISE